jgi:hypothetical protein
MGVRVTLPPGCDGINCADGSRYSASRAGGSVILEDHHAAAIPKSRLQDMLSSSFAVTGAGTKKGRYCPCSPLRIWNSWSRECPKCGQETSDAL